jgi:cell division protein FtsZ
VPFIPPQAERPMRPTRMPRVEDLPVPAQNQLRATRGEADAAAHHDQRRMSLLQRIATVGLGRKDGPGGPPAPAERPSAPSGRPPGEGPQRPTVSPAHAEYSKRAAPQGYRPAQGGLDPHGRAPAQPKGLDDEQLEIPAFLRRQTN